MSTEEKLLFFAWSFGVIYNLVKLTPRKDAQDLKQEAYFCLNGFQYKVTN